MNINEKQLLQIKIPLLHATVLLSAMERKITVTDIMKEFLMQECNNALDECEKIESALEKKQTITNSYL